MGEAPTSHPKRPRRSTVGRRLCISQIGVRHLARAPFTGSPRWAREVLTLVEHGSIPWSGAISDRLTTLYPVCGPDRRDLGSGVGDRIPMAGSAGAQAGL